MDRCAAISAETRRTPQTIRGQSNPVCNVHQSPETLKVM